MGTQKYELLLSCLLTSKTVKLIGELHRSSSAIFFLYISLLQIFLFSLR